MSPVIGEFALCAGLLASAGSILAAVGSIRFDSKAWLTAAKWGVGLVALLVTASSAVLVTAFIGDDFRIAYVASYSERALPLGYKLAAFWAGQEGSLLLWAWILVVMSAIAVSRNCAKVGAEVGARVAVLAGICGFFVALLLFAANPFTLVEGVVPQDGRGLNPMLQNVGMIIHPPLLFVGYAGCAIPFAVLVGALVAGRRDNQWLALVRRPLLVAWLFLSAGILLGAWWAYVELGWGGYWAWDPVENASLLPWLTSTALLHSIMVQQHRGMFKRWNASLIAATFILCIFGTYLTRSGVIDSVHSFAPSLIGSFFLAFLLILLAGSTGLILYRIKSLTPEHRLEGLVSREGAFLVGVVLLTLMMVTTLVGTIFPILSGIFSSDPVTVKPAFYNRVVAPMSILLVGIMAIGPVLVFGRNAAATIGRNLIVPSVVALGVTVIVAALGVHSIWALVCVAITAVGTMSVLDDFVRSLCARRRSTGEAWAVAAALLIDRNHRRYGGQLAHLGLMMIVIGVAGSSFYSTERIVQLRTGEAAEVGRYMLTLDSLDEVQGENYRAVQATVTLTEPDGTTLTLRPQKRLYDKWQEEFNTEVALESTLREDVYLVLAGWEAGGEVIAIQVLVNPLVIWIWLGGIVMAAGCLFCLAPRLLPNLALARSANEDRANGSALGTALRPSLQAPGLQSEAST